MNQLARLAGSGDEVIPAARDVRLLVEAEDMGGYGVAVMMVVEEPAVVAGLAEGGLNRFEVHSGILRGNGGGFPDQLQGSCPVYAPWGISPPWGGLGQIVRFQCAGGKVLR